MSWKALFDRAAVHDVDVESITEALSERRAEREE